MKRVYHIFYLTIINVFVIIIKMFLIYKSKTTKKSKLKSIASLPYYPRNWYGGDIRISNWKKFFEEDNISFDVFWAWDDKELLNHQRSNWIVKYYINLKITTRRFFVFFKLFNYRVIWIQRAYIPHFPFKKAIFESLLTRAGFFWVIDFYDPDYQHNPDFVNECALKANKVTVANGFLKEYFENIGCQKVIRINLSIDACKYIPKKCYEANEKVVIGWMGSPSNSIEIFEIKESLIKVQQLYSNVIFLFICNDFQNIPNLKYQVIPWNESTFYSTINSFDIGIVPISHSTNKHLKGKVAMKSLEMMVTGIPMVCSPYGVSDLLVNGENAMIVEDEGEWEIKIIELIKNSELRRKIGVSAIGTYYKHHSYSSQYKFLKEVLN